MPDQVTHENVDHVIVKRKHAISSNSIAITGRLHWLLLPVILRVMNDNNMEDSNDDSRR